MWQLVGESCIHRVQGYWDTIEGGIERERKCTSTKHKCSTKKPAWKGDEVRPGCLVLKPRSRTTADSL